MHTDNDMAAQRLAEWLDRLEQSELPEWENLPQLDLYMDQVILLLTRYLAPMGRDGEERAITASIINNYVRMKVMPPPVKKKYSRSHLACLVMICTLKQSLSISCIQRLLPEDRSEDAIRRVYTEFVQQYRRAVTFIRRITDSGDRLPVEDGDSLVIISAILATLSKSLTEFLLHEEEDGEED